jgi:molybdenum cofactor synthesis domain-containing protein
MAAMRPIKETISLEDARARIAAALRPVTSTERVLLGDAHGRVLAETVTASADVPPFARAAMDGYAVRAADTRDADELTPRRLQVVGHAFTGAVPDVRVGAGQCLEIATGAPMPEGADAVVMVERTRPAPGGEGVEILAQAHPGQHVGPRGADIAAGQTALAAGDYLNASRVGALAALGLTSVEVYVRPRVAILSTGNEVVDPGHVLAPGQIYDINRFTLAALVAQHGGLALPRRAAADTLEDLSRAVDDCRDADVLVFSGGSSVGARDLVTDVLRARGELLFHGIAVKPGKPTAFGLIEGRPFFGMPGYPASCLSNGYVLLVPALRQVARLPEHAPPTARVPLGAAVESVAGRLQFFPVRVEKGRAVPAFKASGDITSLSRADGYIEIPAETEQLEEGTVVEVTLL